MRRVAGGGTVLDPEVVAQLLGRRRREDPLDALTPREREVLGLMAEGRSNTAIAEALVVTEGAVEKHVTKIFTKLDLRRRPRTTAACSRCCLARSVSPMPTPNPGRASRLLWLGGGSLAAVVFFGFFGLQSGGRTATSDRDGRADRARGRASPSSTSPAGQGDIEVVGADVDEITVTSRIQHGIVATNHTVEVEGDTLVIRASWSVRASAPSASALDPAVALRLQTDNGDVDVREIEGSVDVDSDNGDIHLLRVMGWTSRCLTDNGTIDA